MDLFVLKSVEQEKKSWNNFYKKAILRNVMKYKSNIIKSIVLETLNSELKELNLV